MCNTCFISCVSLAVLYPDCDMLWSGVYPVLKDVRKEGASISQKVGNVPAPALYARAFSFSLENLLQGSYYSSCFPRAT